MFLFVIYTDNVWMVRTELCFISTKQTIYMTRKSLRSVYIRAWRCTELRNILTSEVRKSTLPVGWNISNFGINDLIWFSSLIPHQCYCTSSRDWKLLPKQWGTSMNFRRLFSRKIFWSYSFKVVFLHSL